MKEKYIDLVGVVAATICLVHCLIFPILFILPLGLSHDVYVDVTFFIIGILPVYKAVKAIAPIYVKALLIGSLLLIGTHIILDMFMHLHSYLIYVGAVGLIVGHIINFKNHKH